MSGKTDGQDEIMRIRNQLCFPLYAASRELTKFYHPFLTELGLTYTQFIALQALWHNDGVALKDLGEILFLDSGTLTPLLKSLEKKGLITRCRASADHRVLVIELTDAGRALEEPCMRIPEKVREVTSLSLDQVNELSDELYRIVAAFHREEEEEAEAEAAKK